jgi:hypothetical protein
MQDDEHHSSRSPKFEDSDRNVHKSLRASDSYSDRQEQNDISAIPVNAEESSIE